VQAASIITGILLMAYLALARRYRPRTFAEVVGQDHVVRALGNALEQGRLHHAYLFSGTRGVGKTTLARILARCFNCEQGVTAKPCGQCSACQAIDTGRFVDLIEVDAASRTRVEETRDLLDSVPYAPVQGRYKVYLIDEVHMLSTSSFNALLKTLEEPPEHVKFLLATTEPERVPLTVRSRCLVFALQRVPIAAITATLVRIAREEGIGAPVAVFELLARAARGSLRDALSLLDQALAYGGNNLSAEDVAAMLGMAGRETAYDLLERLAAGDGPGLLECLANAVRGVAEPGGVLVTLCEALALIARQQLVPEAVQPTGIPFERVRALATGFAPEVVQLNYDIALAGQRDVALASNPEIALEMVLLRMLAFRPASVEVDPVRTRPASSGRPPVVSPSNPSVKRSECREIDQSFEKNISSGPRAVPDPDSSPESMDWGMVLSHLTLGVMTHELAQHCAFESKDGNNIRLCLDPRHQPLLTPKLNEELRLALSRYFDAPITLRIETESGVKSPATRRAAEQAARQAAAVEAIDKDENILALREAFGAEVLAGTIRPEVPGDGDPPMD